VLHVGPQDSIEMPWPQDPQPVQALGAERLGPALRTCVRIRCPMLPCRGGSSADRSAGLTNRLLVPHDRLASLSNVPGPTPSREPPQVAQKEKLMAPPSRHPVNRGLIDDAPLGARVSDEGPRASWVACPSMAASPGRRCNFARRCGPCSVEPSGFLTVTMPVMALAETVSWTTWLAVPRSSTGAETRAT
jgi:hypothetical protein